MAGPQSIKARVSTYLSHGEPYTKYNKQMSSPNQPADYKAGDKAINII